MFISYINIKNLNRQFLSFTRSGHKVSEIVRETNDTDSQTYAAQ